MSETRRLSSAADYEEVLDLYDTWLFDCDGVLWRGSILIDGVLEVLDFLRSRSMLSSSFTFILIYDLTSHRQEHHIRNEQCDALAQVLQI